MPWLFVSSLPLPWSWSSLWLSSSIAAGTLLLPPVTDVRETARGGVEAALPGMLDATIDGDEANEKDDGVLLLLLLLLVVDEELAAGDGILL